MGFSVIFTQAVKPNSKIMEMRNIFIINFINPVGNIRINQMNIQPVQTQFIIILLALKIFSCGQTNIYTYL